MYWASFVVEIWNKWSCLHLTKMARTPILTKELVHDSTIPAERLPALNPTLTRFACLKGFVPEVLAFERQSCSV